MTSMSIRKFLETGEPFWPELRTIGVSSAFEGCTYRCAMTNFKGERGWSNSTVRDDEIGFDLRKLKSLAGIDIDINHRTLIPVGYRSQIPTFGALSTSWRKLSPSILLAEAMRTDASY